MPYWSGFLMLLPVAALSSTMLDSAQANRLNRYNHRVSVGLSDANKMKRFAKIDVHSAKEIAKRECGAATISFVSLKRRGRLLYYELVTDVGRARINALDGETIQCKGKE